MTASVGNRVPAAVLFVVGGASMYLGAALAVVLFDRLSPTAVAMLRLVGAAAVLVAWRRPARDAWRGRRLRRATAFGLVTSGMNVAFYESVARLPLGTATAVEFCGPVLVAAAASRRPRDVAAVVLAAGGVALIAEVRWSGSSEGMLWALVAAALWAVYIVLGKRVANGGTGLDDLAVGFAVAATVLAPPMAVAGSLSPAAPVHTLVLLSAAGVGVLSSVVPYVLDQLVLRRVGKARFAVLLAVLPATAAVVGAVTLAQVPGTSEAVGIAAVVAAAALRSHDGDDRPQRSIEMTLHPE